MNIEILRARSSRVVGSLDETLDYLKQNFASTVKGHKTFPAQPGKYAAFPPSMCSDLQQALHTIGIKHLYDHQRAAFETISTGKDSVLVARTASGKTLSFLLPILNEYISSDKKFSVLLLYPTKALSRDQESTLGRLAQLIGAQGKLGTFDGDTPPEERVTLQKQGDFIISNPDMLHSGVLPNHQRRWRDFLARLRYIVVDEVHTYRGAFGSHASNVFRRLLRVCELHGSNPTIVAASATIGNPKEHVEALFHRPFSLIDGDGAPKPQRDLYFVNPPLVKGLGDSYYRKGPNSLAIPLLRHAATTGVRTICFCRARQEVERLHRAVVDGRPELREKIQPYRGGLLPSERRNLERQLASGEITAIITTNALELGIDIGDLELCLINGYPGSLASFWQRAGRVGRSGKGAAIIYLAKNTPVDQYLVHHGNFVSETPVEKAWLHADNPYIFLQHLPCAAQEYPLREDEPLFSPTLYRHARDLLLEDGTLKPYKEFWRYALNEFPSKGVNLRGMTDYNIEIFCGTEVIGEIDPIGARGSLYKDAIYQHLGRRYMSLDLDLEKKLCRVEPVEVDYYTEAVWEGRVELTEVLATTNHHGSEVNYGDVYVNKQPKLFKKIRERTYENIGYGPITLAPFEFDTSGFSLIPSRDWQEALNRVDKRFIGAALYGLAYLLRRVAPSFCFADFGDIGTDVSLTSEADQVWKSSLYLYDHIEGGVGYAEKISESLDKVLALCLQIIDRCECVSGCPSCVPTVPPGVQDESIEELLVESNAGTACTHSFLTVLTTGIIQVPHVVSTGSTYVRPLKEAEDDQETKRMINRLSRATKVLARKRGRVY